MSAHALFSRNQSLIIALGKDGKAYLLAVTILEAPTRQLAASERSARRLPRVL